MISRTKINIFNYYLLQLNNWKLDLFLFCDICEQLQNLYKTEVKIISHCNIYTKLKADFLSM